MGFFKTAFKVAKGDISGATHELVKTVAGAKAADALAETALEATKNVISAGSQRLSSGLRGNNAQPQQAYQEGYEGEYEQEIIPDYEGEYEDVVQQYEADVQECQQLIQDYEWGIQDCERKIQEYERKMQEYLDRMQ